MKLPGVFSAPAFKQGFKAVIPLWLAAAPVALAYVLAARHAGINDFEIQFMSVTVYSAAAQIAIAQLLSGGASTLTVLITVLVMNLHHIIYGLSLTKHIRFRRFEKAIAAFGLTDAAYGVTIAMVGKKVKQGNGNVQFLLGAEFSMFVAWNVFTAAALLARGLFATLFATLNDLPLDFIVPLTFFVLLIAIIETPTDLTVVIFSITLAVIFTLIGLGEITLILVGIGGPLLGFGITQVRNSKR